MTPFSAQYGSPLSSLPHTGGALGWAALLAGGTLLLVGVVLAVHYAGRRR
jgi:LPXTG-motif cell wall-anchored protein